MERAKTKGALPAQDTVTAPGARGLLPRSDSKSTKWSALVFHFEEKYQRPSPSPRLFQQRFVQTPPPAASSSGTFSRLLHLQVDLLRQCESRQNPLSAPASSPRQAKLKTGRGGQWDSCKGNKDNPRHGLFIQKSLQLALVTALRNLFTLACQNVAKIKPGEEHEALWP